VIYIKIGGSLIHIVMKIPDVVLQETCEIMEMLEGKLVYLGKIGDGRDVFLLKQPIDAVTGFPFVWIRGLSRDPLHRRPYCVNS
jgi:hypothetical protein